MATKRERPPSCDVRLKTVPPKDHRRLYRIDLENGNYIYACNQCMQELVRRHWNAHDPR
jgi:hypothetical protein